MWYASTEHYAPPKSLTPRYFGFESRLFCVEPAAFFIAMPRFCCCCMPDCGTFTHPLVIPHPCPFTDPDTPSIPGTPAADIMTAVAAAGCLCCRIMSCARLSILDAICTEHKQRPKQASLRKRVKHKAKGRTRAQGRRTHRERKATPTERERERGLQGEVDCTHVRERERERE